LVLIDPDLRELFPDSTAVNKALRDYVALRQRSATQLTRYGIVFVARFESELSTPLPLTAVTTKCQVAGVSWSTT
jgi:hypothetical protein